ncbi:uncharacterized protein METZ01_LOCUS270642, partial [marine metagenome]|tara:strand:- start:279 stop:497 length:219 start_codon:yes stop_codon:yes gene_type:complete
VDRNKIGIYFNVDNATLVRITSPYWIPEEPDWVLISNNPNETLLSLRETIASKKLLANPDTVIWTKIPEIDR